MVREKHRGASPRFERRLWLGLGAAAATGLAAWWAWSVRRTKRVKVAALYVYPIKSCRGHSMGKATVTKWGLEDDRIYMVVDEKNEMVTQRQHPRMALIHPDLPTKNGITLRVADGSLAALHVFLDMKSAPKNVKVWDDWVQAVDQGNAAAEWLSTVLQVPKLRLVRISATAQRATDPSYGLGETAFSDGFPVLVSSTASVALVARKVLRAGGPQIGIDRFRPNIHVDGCKAFEEDEMKALVLSSSDSSLRLPLVKPCSRCTIPGIDPSTGTRTKQTGGALTEMLRRHRAAGGLKEQARLHKDFFSQAKRQEDVYFGQNALCEFQGTDRFEITVGDVALVLHINDTN